LQGVKGELEADLVVALAGAAVRDGEAAFLLRNGDLCAGDDWSSEGGAEKVDVLVDGIAGDCWVAQVFDELPLVRTSLSCQCQCMITYLSSQILNVARRRTNLQRLLLGSLKVLFLANIGHESNHFIAFVLQHVNKRHN